MDVCRACKGEERGFGTKGVRRGVCMYGEEKQGMMASRWVT